MKSGLMVLPVCVLVTASSVLGVGLYAVDPVSPSPSAGYPYSEVFGMTADGQYVVGSTRAADGKLAPYYYNVATQTRIDLPNPTPGSDVKATGIGFRSAANGGAGELVVAATVSGKTQTWHSSTNSWVSRLPLTGTAVYNALAVASNGDTYYVGASGGTTGYRLTADSTGSSYINFSATSSVGVQSVSSTGRAVGTGKGINGDANQRAFWTDNGTMNLLPGLDPFTNVGFAYTASADGSAIGGMVRDPNLGRYVPAHWDVATSALTVLPVLPGTSSTSVMYAMTADGKLGGGMNFVGGGVEEQAVLYDMRDPSSANWQTLNLKDYLDGLGFDTSGWARLGRVTSISADGTVIAGYGIRAGDPYLGYIPPYASYVQYTGFVAVTPEPATLGLLALGGLMLVRRRR